MNLTLTLIVTVAFWGAVLAGIYAATVAEQGLWVLK